VSFAGDASGGVLTITDAQNHAAHLTLVGNYTNSTFNLSSDGSGGTMVIDPPKSGFDFVTPPVPAGPEHSGPAAHVHGDGFVFTSDGIPASGHAHSPIDLPAAEQSELHHIWSDIGHDAAVDAGIVFEHVHHPESHHQFLLH
jgi:hypothetical protein